MKFQKTFTRMKGIAIVEMAIVVPVLVTMLFGILEFGIVLYDKAIVTNLSLQLALAGSQKTQGLMTVQNTSSPPALSVNDPALAPVFQAFSVGAPASTFSVPSSIVDNLTQFSLITFDAAKPKPTAKATLDLQGNTLGYPLSVTVSYTYKSLVLRLFSGMGLPDPIPLSSTTSMYLN